jgi:hypothetical protein
MTLAPQPAAFCRSRMAFPIAQYSSMSWVLTTREAVHCADRIWAFKSASRCG